MSTCPFRFIHASDFHLERPLMGVADVPDHLRELFLEAPYKAARQVFDAALAEDANFVVLSGGIVVPSDTGPRGPLLLAEQFARLAERGIGVYWAGSPIDPPEAWPAAVKLPPNVHFFPRGQVENLLVQGEAGPLAAAGGHQLRPAAALAARRLHARRRRLVHRRRRPRRGRSGRASAAGRPLLGARRPARPEHPLGGRGHLRHPQAAAR